MLKYLQSLCIVATILITSNINAQVEYNLTVRNNQGQPYANKEVIFVETSTYDRISLKTDGQGKLQHTFETGALWLGTIGKMRNCLEVESNHRGTARASTTYDPVGFELENRKMPDRRSIDFKHIPQKGVSRNALPTEKESIVTVTLRDRERRTYSGISLSLCDYKNKTMYDGVTNTSGLVTFKIPISNTYDVDIDGVEGLFRFELGKISGNSNYSMLFQERKFTEIKEDRFIIQDFKPDVKASSTHARVKLKVKGGDKGGIQEDVYVRMLKSNKVYRVKTDDSGDATLLLPIRQKYSIDFMYQRDAMEIDLTKDKGIIDYERYAHYVPDPRLRNIEDFIPKVNHIIAYDMHNFVDEQYPEPTNKDVDFYLKWGNKYNENSKEAILEIGLKIATKVKRKITTPLNICFVVDKSGSMSRNMEELKNSLAHFVEQLNPTDVVSLVVFNNSSTVAIPAQTLGDKKKITDIIHALGAGGGTSIYEGLVKGFDEVQKFNNKKHITRLVLLSDGFGSRPVNEVIDLAKKNIQLGIEISAIGAGYGYNEALLSQLASAGGGMLHFAGNSSNIQEAFQRELESILYAAAKDGVLEVLYNDKIIYRQLYGYTNEKVSKGKMKVEIPHIFPGLSQMALIKFDLINPTKSSLKDKVVVRFSYSKSDEGKRTAIEKKTSPDWTDATGELDMTIDKEHKKVLAVAIANQSLKVMANSFEAGNRESAKKSVQSALDQIEELFPNAKSEELLAVVERLTEYVRAFEKLALLRQY